MDLIHNGKKVRRVGFIGFGRSNRGVYEALTKKYSGLEYCVRSSGEPEDLPKNCRLILAEAEFDSFFEDIIFLSPTVKRDRIELSAPSVRERLSSDTAFFFERTKSPCFVITGSDGKSTTAKMTAELLSLSGKKAEAIGNIGEAMTPRLDDADTRFSVELSSFQLMDTAPRAKRAVILNISPNHLDWHSSFDEYKSAKANATKNADERIFSLDSEAVLPIIKEQGAYALFSTRLTLSEMKRTPAEIYYHLHDGYICRQDKRILRISELFLKEEHYLKNFLAALALTDGEAEPEGILKLARSFRPLAHRCTLVYTGDGVEFYDSSIDSSPERTKTTLRGFSKNHILILGGRSKGLGYESLSSILTERTRAIVITGENREEIVRALSDCTIPIHIEKDFTEAVATAAKLGQNIGAVLLSPASTSFDSFKNFEERGARFAEIARSLNKEK